MPGGRIQGEIVVDGPVIDLLDGVEIVSRLAIVLLPVDLAEAKSGRLE